MYLEPGCWLLYICCLLLNVVFENDLWLVSTPRKVRFNNTF